jgi:nitrous oxidase accessory protein NosD
MKFGPYFTPISVSVLFLGTLCSAATLRVGQPNTSCPNAQYTTITAAVKAAASGDVVEICPAFYPEQLIITKPLTLRGVLTDVNSNDVNRALLRPNRMLDLQGLPVEAVITVMNAQGVTIENLAIDASRNAVTGCTPSLADIHYFNSSGRVDHNAIFGAQLANPQGCATLAFPGNGFGVLVDSNQPGPFNVSVDHNSIHDFTKDGIQALTAGVTVEIAGNTISGVGPAGGIFLQFGVFVVNGAVGLITGNVINEGGCGTLAALDCFNARSEGVTIRAAGEGTVVDHNVITTAQSGIFINGGNNARITNNLVSNINPGDGIDIQGTASGFFTNSLIDGNTISNITPITNESCGVFEFPGTGVAGNTISHNTVNDAYCGVAYVPTDRVETGAYFNTLYTQLRSDLPLPRPTEP